MASFENILNQYNAEEKADIRMAIFLNGNIGNIDKAPITEIDFKNFCDKVIADKKAREKAIADKKAKKEQGEIVKAIEMKMTIEEYQTYKKNIANMKRHMAEIRKAEKTIAEMKRKIAYEEKRVAEYKEKINL